MQVRDSGEKPPLRAELFSAAQMEQHGKDLALAHRLATGRMPDQLLGRLAENERVLLEISALLAGEVADSRRITPASDWLLDNFYLVEEQIRTAKLHLPRGYSRELPRLALGASARLPRVYDLALESISHGDGRVDAESLSRFIAAYQTVSPLKMGELWAIPIMLRLALIENLRRVGVRIRSGTVDRSRADAWADQMLAVAEEDPKSLILITADMARSDPPMVSSFVAELARRLQGQSAALALPLTWIEQRLSESGFSIAQLVQTQAQEQAADQVSISNTIGSLRFLAAMDWRTFVETMSIVEQELHADPARVYAAMDFETRDRYRHVVEQVAAGSDASEVQVAQAAIQLARAHAATPRAPDEDSRQTHVGYYLSGKGREHLERAVAMRVTAPEAVRRAVRRAALPTYLGSIAAITAGLTAALAVRAFEDEVALPLVVALAALLAVAASELAVGMVNWLATLLVTPQPLPRMDFSHGIPMASRTMVVVPTMLVDSASLEALLEALEVRFLANRDEHLHFSLLTDFEDALQESLPADAPLLALAQAGIDALNEKYGRGGDAFFLFHRPRRWNSHDRMWMGEERKRGKLGDLNAYLRGGARDRFCLVVGETQALSSVRYVITLDTDTQLPRDAARHLVAVMDHPLNRALFAGKDHPGGTGTVVEGYGILQPRLSTSLPGARRSWYARLNAGDPGIDPYTRAVSDVYQDIACEGSFIGKGIYDVDAFERALGGRFPANRILSHDLLEGCYARSGLLSDVQLYEEYPSTYRSDVGRRHRWMRGDWQLAAWLLPTVPGPGKQRLDNPLSALSRWKLFDNLRRSLVAPGLTLLLLLAWMALPRPWLWTLAVVAIYILPTASGSIVDLLRRRPDGAMPRQALAAVAGITARHAARIAITLAFLPYEASVNLDAIARTSWRMLFSHRRLLEWKPTVADDQAPAARQPAGSELAASAKAMWIAPVIAVAAALILALIAPGALAAAAPLLLLWCASPAIAWGISRPLVRRDPRLTQEQSLFLRKLARRTWAFFDRFVDAGDRWLPPDNFQEHPTGVIAHRTSPTNMGLALLANLTAYDFAFIAAGQLIARTASAIDTMRALERYEGHFYNWYDTQTLEPLAPRYVSSVDSGNLAGHLMTLRPGLLALADDPIVSAKWFEGLSVTLHVLMEAEGASPQPALANLQLELQSAITWPAATLAGMQACLDDLGSGFAKIADGLAPPAQEAAASQDAGDAAFWAAALVRQCRALQDELAFLVPTGYGAGIPTLRELAALEAQWASGRERRATARVAELDRLARHCDELALMQYDFLYDRERDLLSIGYNVTERRLDPSYYDLLASEARFASFVAISQGQLPQASWFALGRRLTTSGGEPVLLSWSGSMFEYLMPLLVMPTYEDTLLDQTYRTTIARQVAYGKQKDVPWGISECGYNSVDASLNYQYRAFGVPGLGLKRGLAEDLVVAPYASALGLMVSPEAACVNLQQLAAAGLAGRFGLHEAIDYTPARVPRGQAGAVVRSFMAHHQGMILLSIAYLLLQRPMQKRFESDPLFKASLLLLQERVPKFASFQSHPAELSALRGTSGGQEAAMRAFSTPNTPSPEVQLLSNGRYHVMVTNAGGGSSRWKDLAVTRWREDTTCDQWGAFCYLRDVASGAFWSGAHQPTLVRAASYEAIFTEGRAEFRRIDNEIESHTEIAVSPEDDIELRRVRITNRSRMRRTLEVTSYAEVVLAPAAADALHPAFSNLFVQTQVIAQHHAILCTRRPRSAEEQAPWMFHLMAVHGVESLAVSYETDRLAFVGRGRTPAAPRAMLEAGSLEGNQGSVLDPIVAVRHRICLEAQQTATIDIATGMSETREGALGLAGKYHDHTLADRVFDLAWTHGGVTLRQINATEADAQVYARLAGPIVFANAMLRAEPAVLFRNHRGQSGLWSYAISGDLPIVLLQVSDSANIELVRRMVQAHAYWRLKGLAVDMVIWNEDRGGYRQVLQDQIMGLIAAGVEANVIDRPGGIFVRRADQVADEDRVLLHSVARVIVTDRKGELGNQVVRRAAPEARIPRLAATRAHRDVPASAAPRARELILANPLGGFTPDGSEYVITLSPGEATPAPWVNVIANPHFGTVVSESGLAYTWAENAHEFRVTPWNNDPVSDASGEALYLRDEETGHAWSPAALPMAGSGDYVARHGFGYSVFEHEEAGIATELWIYVALDASVKFSVLKVRNASGAPRRLSATGYVEWVLGDLRAKTAMHVTTEIEAKSGALIARNAYNTEFPDRVAFLDVDEPRRGVSADRTEFLGRNGSLRNPAAMQRMRLSGKVGAGLDPCGAVQVAFDLAEGEERQVIFRLGVGRDAQDAAVLVQRFRGVPAARAALDDVRAHWKRILGAVQLDSPDPALDVMANGWLVYQTIACRLWARSGYYQSGGAFGFRDQLQDVMALVHTEPGLVREQVLRCAGRQFLEGDVQHWWHPPSGRGVRTRCSDDYLWLPLAVARYVQATGDRGILQQRIAYLAGRPVNARDDSYYDLPGRSDESGTLYDHCVRAVIHGLRFGVHGLPLMGSGDWNDGMNRVGIEGTGESVWLGFFLYDVLARFAVVAHAHGDRDFAQRCADEGARLRGNLELHGWDGAWYRRAYFDDGTPLGSAGNEECRIDSISQSWSVLSGAGDVAHTHAAMRALDEHLVRRELGLIQLLDPPFDKSPLDPGYIRGYVPGVRENGGQYTHGAIWAAMAFAAIGDGPRAWELTTMMNPVNRSRTPQGMATYKVEPYVIAADVYAVAPHAGRGGWTWYTGSAGWMYRLVVESLLGLAREGNRLRFAPCLPEAWPECTLRYRYGEGEYTIVMRQVPRAGEDDVPRVTLDGVPQPDASVPLVEDRAAHHVEVILPSGASSPRLA